MRFSVFTFLLFSFFASAQTDHKKQKSFFFEVGGSGGLGSLNYERSCRKAEKLETTFRAGFSIAPISQNNGFGIVLPLMYNVLLGKSSHKLECGLGLGMTITTQRAFFILAPAAIGYRYQPEDKSWFYRITYSPLISFLVDFQVQQWAGVSIGYSVKKMKQ